MSNIRRPEIFARCVVADNEMGLEMVRHDDAFQRRVSDFLVWFEANFVPPTKVSWPNALRVFAFILSMIVSTLGCSLLNRYVFPNGLEDIVLNDLIVTALSSWLVARHMLPDGASRIWVVLVLGIVAVCGADDIIGCPEFTKLKWISIFAALLTYASRNITTLAFYTALLHDHPLIDSVMRFESAVPSMGWPVLACGYVLLHMISEIASRGSGNVRPLLVSLSAQAVAAAVIAIDRAAPFEEPLFYFFVRAVPLALIVRLTVPELRSGLNLEINSVVLQRLDSIARYVRFYIKNTGKVYKEEEDRLDVAAIAIELHEKLSECRRPEDQPVSEQESDECEVCGTDVGVSLYDRCGHEWSMCFGCRKDKFVDKCPICDERLG